MQTLKINLHGESWTLKKFECSEEDLNDCMKVAAKMKLPLVKALLDPFFLLLPQKTFYSFGGAFTRNKN